MYLDSTKKTGYRVKEYFPELAKKWKLFTGDLPHKFLVKLNMKFDFLFLDTAHMAPGELLNFIEVLPFLKENAIIVLHDIIWHFVRTIKFYPSNIYLISAIHGDKVMCKDYDGKVENIGAIFLYPNQEKHYFDYFLLLLAFWEYMPTDEQINDLRIFIKTYYKKKIYLKLFEQAVENNRKSIQRNNKYNNLFNQEDYKFIMKSIGNNSKNIV